MPASRIEDQSLPWSICINPSPRAVGIAPTPESSSHTIESLLSLAQDQSAKPYAGSVSDQRIALQVHHRSLRRKMRIGDSAHGQHTCERIRVRLLRPISRFLPLAQHVMLKRLSGRNRDIVDAGAACASSSVKALSGICTCHALIRQGVWRRQGEMLVSAFNRFWTRLARALITRSVAETVHMGL